MKLMEMLEIIHQHRNSVPVDVRSVAEEICMRVSLDDRMDNDESAEVKYTGSDEFSLIVNANLSRIEQRYTIAHELGHFWHHEAILKKAVKYKENSSHETTNPVLFTSFMETQAHGFAIDLLLPKGLIVRLMRKGISTEMELAHEFDVSVELMKNRLEFCGLIPIEPRTTTVPKALAS